MSALEIFGPTADIDACDVRRVPDTSGDRVAETAEVLGISEANVRTRLHRARLQMRDALAPGVDGAWIRGRDWERVRPW